MITLAFSIASKPTVSISTEFINSIGHGEGFCLGNIIKYAQRFGKKGSSIREKERELFKIIHYAVILLNELETKK